MKTFNKMLAIILAIVTAATCLSVNNVGNVTLGPSIAIAASKSTQAKKAYASKLAKAAKGYDVFNVVGQDSDIKFAVVKLNNDSIPELIVSADDWYHSYIYSYVNGKVKLITDGFSGELKFYPSKNLIYSQTIHTGDYRISYMKFNGKKVTEVASKFGNDTYDAITGKLKKSPQLGNFAPYLYKVNNKVTTKQKYQDYVKKTKGTAKTLKVKLIKNTSSNRLKQLGYKG